MMAETMGMFRLIAGCSPFLYRTNGVLRLTFSGMFSAPGRSSFEY